MKTNILLTIFTFLIIASCSKEKTSCSIPNPVIKIDSISFSRNIKPILIGNCSDPNCHNGMDEYANLIAQPKPLVVANDTTSLFSLYQSVYTKRMPQGKIKLADSSIKQIGDWIMQGALNN
ncbi:MAG: hypothetical protein EBZ58_10295 [Bacteroidetes bacterium]|jgi:hypothetical protein|nr:hypothetical protein [Bacteroidota bacterium]